VWTDRSRFLDPTGTDTWKLSGGGSMFRGASVLEPEVTESGEFYAVNDEIRRWLSLSEGECQLFVEDGVLKEFDMMLQLRVLFPLHFFGFQTDCVSPTS
jgi:hypothetical protein